MEEVLQVLPNLLPPASEGWGKVIFSLCMSVHTLTGGEGGVPCPADGVGGIPIPGQDRGYPISGPGWGGYLHLRPRMEGTPSQDRGVPHPRSGPGGTSGYPQSGLDGGTPSQD